MQTFSILLVEDDFDIAQVILNYLQKQSYCVTWASTGKEGWEEFRLNNYDLAIIDLMLPELDGFTLCQNIRMESDIPLLIISAKHEEDSKVKGLKLGADDYLTKPFSLRELEARVSSQLRRYRKFYKESENILSFHGELTIYPDKKSASLYNEELPLTLKEFSLLSLLAKNPEKTFSKKELYEHIWGESDVDGNNTITVHIKSLRTKLNDSQKTPVFIQTVWGSGYRFIGVEKH